MSGFEVKPEDIRNSSKDVNESVSRLPRDILQGFSPDADHGNEAVAKAVGDFQVGIDSAVQILRSKAEEAVMALRSIAEEYEGHDLTQSKELGTQGGLIGKGNLY